MSARYCSVLIQSDPAENDEDDYEIRIPKATVEIQQDNNGWGSTQVTFKINPFYVDGVLYSHKEIPGPVTKGALALYKDKHPDADKMPYLGYRATTDLARRLRRKAKAVLDAAKA